MNALKKLGHIYDKLEEYALVYTMAACVVIVFAQVVSRKVFNSSLSWSEELTKYLFVWLIWLGTSLAAKDKEHINLTLVLDRVGFRTRCVLEIIIKLIWGGLCVFLLVNGTSVVGAMIRRGKMAYSMPWLKVWLVYLAVPVSQGVLAVRLLIQMVDDVRNLINGEDGSLNAVEGGDT